MYRIRYNNDTPPIWLHTEHLPLLKAIVKKANEKGNFNYRVESMEEARLKEKAPSVPGASSLIK